MKYLMKYLRIFAGLTAMFSSLHLFTNPSGILIGLLGMTIFVCGGLLAFTNYASLFEK